MTQVPDALIRKLSEIEQEFLILDLAIQDPDLFNDPDQARIKLKEHGRLKPMVESFRAFNKIREDIAANKALIAEEDAELRALAEAELPELKEAEAEAADTLKDLFVSQDKDSESDVIVEINAGVGGDEASLFAGDLFRMYVRYAERRRWKLEVIDQHEGNVGGLKYASFTVEGQGVYRQLRFESGGHRVQRVPSTETQGRIHTSMCTVVVLPQVEEVDVEIDKADVKIDKYSASGPGGQHVNKTQSAVRLTHGATGIVVQCQDEKSQHKNLARAWKVLRARVSDHYMAIAEKERGDQRRSLRGRGNRNERIRTYNFPQDRCTDHRVGVTVHGLAQIMDGDLDGLIEKLIATDKEETLKNL